MDLSDRSIVYRIIFSSGLKLLVDYPDKNLLKISAFQGNKNEESRLTYNENFEFLKRKRN